METAADGTGAHFADRQVVYMVLNANAQGVDNQRRATVWVYQVLAVGVLSVLAVASGTPAGGLGKWLAPLIMIFATVGVLVFDRIQFSNWRNKIEGGRPFETATKMPGAFSITKDKPYRVIGTVFTLVYVFWMGVWAFLLWLLERYDIAQLRQMPDFLKSIFQALGI